MKNTTIESNSLILRNSNLTIEDISEIANMLKSSTTDFIKIISLSYNEIGDFGASLLAKSMPLSINEVELVGCKIGDEGGIEILHWMKNATNLKMICIEQNNFSEQLKSAFTEFKRSNPQVIVVF
ncbi:MAG: hypothetical protein ACJAZY_003738 [Spirosomataceae bacterium]|jgi:hypothetical protein